MIKPRLKTRLWCDSDDYERRWDRVHRHLRYQHRRFPIIRRGRKRNANTGAHTAPDGHRLTWCVPCLTCTRVPWCKQHAGKCTNPASVRAFDAHGIAQWRISGRISARDLERTLAQFKREHCGQLELWRQTT